MTSISQPSVDSASAFHENYLKETSLSEQGAASEAQIHRKLISCVCHTNMRLCKVECSVTGAGALRETTCWWQERWGSAVLLRSWRQKRCSDKKDNRHASHSSVLKTIKGRRMGEKSNFDEEMSAVNFVQVQCSPHKGCFVSAGCGSVGHGLRLPLAMCFYWFIYLF